MNLSTRQAMTISKSYVMGALYYKEVGFTEITVCMGLTFQLLLLYFIDSVDKTGAVGIYIVF